MTTKLGMDVHTNVIVPYVIAMGILWTRRNYFLRESVYRVCFVSLQVGNLYSSISNAYFVHQNTDDRLITNLPS